MVYGMSEGETSLIKINAHLIYRRTCRLWTDWHVYNDHDQYMTISTLFFGGRRAATATVTLFHMTYYMCGVTLA